jgi:hypothetical protein
MQIVNSYTRFDTKNINKNGQKSVLPVQQSNINMASTVHVPTKIFLSQFNTKLNKISFNGSASLSVVNEYRIERLVNPDLEIINSDKPHSNLPLAIVKKEGEFINKHFFNKLTGEKLGYALNLYRSKNDPYADKLMELCNENNIRKVAQEYSDFYSSNLKSLEQVKKGEREFTTFWVENKDFGDKKLADFWLLELGHGPATVSAMSSEQKAKELNHSIQNNEKADNLVFTTIDHWFKNIYNKKDNPKETEKTEDGNNQKRLEEILSVKTMLEKIEATGKDSFMEFVNSKEFEQTKINGKPVIDLMLEPLEDEGADFSFSDFDTKKSYLEEFSDDEKVKKQMLTNVLSPLRKEYLVLKTQQDKFNKLGENYDVKSSNIDLSLVKKLYEMKPARLAKEIVDSVEDFEDNSTKQLNSLLPENPLLINAVTSSNTNDSLNVVFSLINERINTTKGDEAVSIIEKLGKYNELAEQKMEDRDKDESKKVWNDLLDAATSQWKERHLPLILNQRLKDNIYTEQIMKTPVGQMIKEKGVSEIVIESPNYTAQQKALVAQKAATPFGSDFCEFLINHPSNDLARSRFIDNLIEADKQTEQDFDTLARVFKDGIRKNDIQNPILTYQINGKSLIDHYVENIMTSKEEYPRRTEDKVQRLATLTDEEFELLGNKIKDKYITQGAHKSFHYEADKYDLAQNMGQMMVTIDGKHQKLEEVIKNDFAGLCKKFEDSHQETINFLDILDEDIASNNTKTLEHLQKMEIVLDKALKYHPENAREIREAKSWIRKNIGSISVVGGIAILSALTGGAALPAALSAGANASAHTAMIMAARSLIC